ncbi:MAG: hypothetical protein GY808_08260 [Gammaproteobacteria bacterium]|nr:hypothetical protein [Gammaproteobacteria bacterium]
MITSLQSGFSSNAIITNLVFSTFLSFFIWGMDIAGVFGLFAIPALVILIPWFFQYCFDTGKAAVNGALEPPVHQFKSIVFAPILFTLICFILYKLSSLYLGTTYTIILLSLIVPTLISSFLVEEELLQIVNPINWLRYFVLLRLNYFVLSLILIAAALLLSQIPSGLWLWPKLFVYQTIMVATCFTIGHLLHLNRVVLNILTPETEDERSIRVTSESDTADFEKQTDRLFRLSEVHEYKKALAELLSYLSKSTDQLEYAIRVMDELLVWRTPALSAKFVPHYIQLLIEHNKPAKAFAVYQMIVERYGPIPLHDKISRMTIIQFANEAGNYQLAEDLVA